MFEKTPTAERMLQSAAEEVLISVFIVSFFCVKNMISSAQ
jgi:hypothetical protein